ncbi:hypothetical protein DXG03_007702 [Asterophora parasitica]|uniref:Uncharacterized protein n=1 Tax=Asterophora parasitica TaxID=117018 RepID=A0A9P7G0Q1_9AGAR|nr:hypothetical protein DXG03_007702 [Asterophora parasitica]
MVNDAISKTREPQAILINKERPKRRVLTLKDLGQAPPLRNQDTRRGRRVAHRILAFPMSEEALYAWAKFYNFAQDASSSLNLHVRIFDELSHHLPRTCRLGLLPHNGDRRDCQFGYFVASNETLEQLSLAKDLIMIQRVMDILQPPIWERPIPDWYVSCNPFLRYHPYDLALEIRLLLLPSLKRNWTIGRSTTSQDKPLAISTDVSESHQPIRVNKKPPKRRVLTLGDLGRTPPLRNQDKSLGRRVAHRVLVFPMSEEALDAWAEFYDIVQDEPSAMNRRIQVFQQLGYHLPRTCKLGLIPRSGDRDDCQYGYFVASNATPQDLELAKDLKVIQRVMDVLQAREPPIWERPLRDWCASFFSSHPAFVLTN